MVERKKNSAGSSLWQIYLPAAVGGVLVVLIGIWFAMFAGSSDISRFAEVSSVLLVIPVFFISLVFGLLLVGTIYLLSLVMKWIPTVTDQVLVVLEKIREGVAWATRAGAGLMIEPLSFLAGFRRRKAPSAEEEIKLND